jgi:hypothetical protein
MSTPLPSGSPWDAHHVPLTQAQRLAQDAASAAELRAYQSDPAVVALRVERIRTQVDRLMWTGITLGLCFTMTNVQQFAAAGAVVWSLAWVAAWLLDPMVSLVLLAVLRAEQLTTRHHVSTGPWPRVAKWVLLSATYVMNTWVSWAARDLAGVVLHSVPPLVVVIAAEAVTDLQYALTDCAHRAAHLRAEHMAEQPEHPTVNTNPPDQPALTGAIGERPATDLGEHLAGAVDVRAASGDGDRSPSGPGSGGEPPRRHRTSRPRPGTRSRTPVRRKLLADYLAEARAAWIPGVVVTPAWVRQVTDCSRGLSPKVAAALNATLPTATHHTTTTARTDEPEGRAA